MQKGELEFHALTSGKKARVSLTENGKVLQDLKISTGEKISVEIQPGKYLEMLYEEVAP
jgi:hypothetical protein